MYNVLIHRRTNIESLPLSTKTFYLHIKNVMYVSLLLQKLQNKQHMGTCRGYAEFRLIVFRPFCLVLPFLRTTYFLYIFVLLGVYSAL